MGKADVQRQYSRAYADSQMYKAKYETEGVTRAEELDGARLKLQARFEEAEQQIDSLNFKYASLEKSKLRLESDYEALHIDYNKLYANTQAAEKKQKNFDKIVAEWKIKVDDLALEYDNSQKEVRNYSTELFRIKACYEENLAAFDSVKRENKNLGDEQKDLLDQIGEAGRNYHEITKTYKRLELRRKNLQLPWRKQKQHMNRKRTSTFGDNLNLAKSDRKLIGVLLRRMRSMKTQGKHILVLWSQCRHHFGLSLKPKLLH